MRINFLVGLICFIFSGLLYAEYDPASLKTLFTDKSQRAQIDSARLGNASSPELQKTQQVELSGYVTRSDGKSVVWLNNKNTLESSMIGDVRVHKKNIGKDRKVTISVDGKTARLKPGEKWSKETGKTADNF